MGIAGGIKSTFAATQSSNSSSSVEKKLPPPSSIQIQSAPQPSPLSDLEKLRLQQQLKEVDRGPEIPQSNKTILGPNVTSQSNVTNITSSQINMTNYNHQNIPIRTFVQSTTSKSAIKLFANDSLTTTDATAVLEPALANNGQLVFYTGNWFAARSTDGGSTWRYIQPLSAMQDFCCDQDVIYDPNHKIFIWYLQGIENRLTGENRIKIGISHDTANWFFYTFKPTDLNSTWTQQMSDYPYLALGNKHLYISMNMFSFGEFIRSIVVRLSLDDLANGVAPSFSYYNDPLDNKEDLFTFTPVQGATDTMYWAVHLSNSRMRIYQWSESTLSVKSYDRDVPAWSRMDRGFGNCPGPDDVNWCGRGISKITGAWITNGVVGFLWNADKGGRSTNNATFPYPYINAATFEVNDNMKYQGRPYIWSPDFAWMYGSASPDKDGNVAVAGVYGGGIYYPSMAAGVYNNISETGPAWNMKQLVKGTNGPSGGQSPFEWGDYLRVRPLSGQGPNWISSGWTLQGGGQDINVEPRYFVFGPERNLTSAHSTQTSLIGPKVEPAIVSNHSNLPTTKEITLSEKKTR